ncbi:MAG: transcriptional regulator [Infirmifilum sp.]|uniref:transcriptional regulator n=1 Tax=Infirmifilum TaxID=2856573 RepID=UPI0023532583
MSTVFGLFDKYVGPAMRRALAVELYNRGFKIGEIAEILGVSRSLVSRYLNGSRGSRAGDIPEDVFNSVKSIADEIEGTSIGPYDVEYRLWQETLKLASEKKFCRLHARVNKRIKPELCQVCVRLFLPSATKV